MIHDDKVVIWGMSCVGKSTFATSMKSHHYHCFDALFDWHSIETLGLSISQSLSYVASQCTQDRYVLDGWHLGDKEGNLLPEDCVVYVLYCPYKKIINQYRKKVDNFTQHFYMFRRWYYEVNYFGINRRVRFWENRGSFVESNTENFLNFLNHNSVLPKD